jgi:hypothetical protein
MGIVITWPSGPERKFVTWKDMSILDECMARGDIISQWASAAAEEMAKKLDEEILKALCND